LLKIALLTIEQVENRRRFVYGIDPFGVFRTANPYRQADMSVDFLERDADLFTFVIPNGVRNL
jgi:hypothetical protein